MNHSVTTTDIKGKRIARIKDPDHKVIVEIWKTPDGKYIVDFLSPMNITAKTMAKKLLDKGLRGKIETIWCG